MAIDVTDATFEQEVLARSDQLPVVVDLWAPWCGPCKTLGPIIEKVVDETEGRVELVKVNIDENPNAARAFSVQSIPAVFALKDRKIVDSFIGALPEQAVREFIGRLDGAPSEADQLVTKGDEESLRAAIALEPDHSAAIETLAELLVDRHDDEEALDLLARIPESAQSRHLAALARLGQKELVSDDRAVEDRLEKLLEKVKEDDEARKEYLDILESLDLSDPRREQFRRALSSRLF